MFKANNLLVYKNRPARLLQVGERLSLSLPGGETARVRPKDVTLLHPGPLNSLTELTPCSGDVQTVWELLLASPEASIPLAELAELIYGGFTPATAWAAWQQVSTGDWFDGTSEAVHARSAAEVSRRVAEREQTMAEQRARKEFLQRAQRGDILPTDRPYLRDVEQLALGRAEHAPLLRTLGHAETPENAHALLLAWGIWDETFNPYPARLDVPTKTPDLPVPELPDEARMDLTHLATYAIDDASTDTPDDALSYEVTPNGERVWVHIADVAALITPDSPLDLEARMRGESLHLPEGTVHMLPRAVTMQLGLGMQPISPALSFGMDISADGEVTGFTMQPSWVRVERITYEDAEARLDEEPFTAIIALLDGHRRRRMANGAVSLDFPEVKIHVKDGDVQITPLPSLHSRNMVEEAMIMTGIQTASFAQQNQIRLPFSQQDAPDSSFTNGFTPGTNGSDSVTAGGELGDKSYARMFAVRRRMRRSHWQTRPGGHYGLGANAYAQVTSPLRRYLDMVAHQQIRAFLRGEPGLSESALLERIGAVEAIIGSLRQAEMLSEKHWTMVYLRQHPALHWEGILVEKRGALGTLLLPDLALEERVHLPTDASLDAHVSLALNGVNLPQHEASFQVSDESTGSC